MASKRRAEQEPARAHDDRAREVGASGVSLARGADNGEALMLLRRSGAPRAADGAVAREIHRAAADGVRGSAGPLPHLAAIQASFGRHDVGRVQAHTDASARASTAAIGARAYARGEHVAFARAPNLFMAAHEAAHVIQQRAGVQLFGGIGRAGDAYERHADAVASRVVRGESAEPLLDRHGGGGGEGVQPSVQCWGEPDHYILGQTAGVLARREIEQHRLSDRSFELGGQEKDPSKGGVYRGHGADVVRDHHAGPKFYLRGEDGHAMSYGAANRFGGDLSPRPLGSAKRGVTLDSWPEQVHKRFAKEQKLDSYDPDHKTGEYLKLDAHMWNKWEEYGLMATNANHFYPLSGVEYRRQHQIARQKMWTAVQLKRAARDNEAHAAAAELARQALIVEGFASHFLADSFAAGHLASHPLGRIDADGNLASVGAKVNTWHDIFNALPRGLPTTLGRFHGDYSMDGHDLEYISRVIANSLLEIAMPWYTGQRFDPKIVLPAPDVAAIRADPVAGPLWRQMAEDYRPDRDRLERLHRRPKKDKLSKYAIYASTTGQQVSNAEAIAPILRNVYGEGLGGLDRNDDTRGRLPAIRTKLIDIADALVTILSYEGGLQYSTGLKQNFEPKGDAAGDYKFRLDLKSAQLAKASPATAPIIPLAAELRFWIATWRRAAQGATEDERRAIDALEASLRLERDARRSNLFRREADLVRSRREYMHTLSGAAQKLRAVRHQVHAPLSLRRQGPQHSLLDNVTDLPVGRGDGADELLARFPNAQAAYDRLGEALNAVAADPWPTSQPARRHLYRLLREAAADLQRPIETAARASQEVVVQTAFRWTRDLFAAIERWEGRGNALRVLPETARRDILKNMREAVQTYYRLDLEQLARTTARVVAP